MILQAFLRQENLQRPGREESMDWDERYSEPDYAYGTAPNDFLVSVAGRIPRGRILSLAEGEGRNAAYLAALGYEVTAVDSSAVGLRKAEALAAGRGITITAIHADLSDFTIERQQWDGVVSCYCHLPTAIRIPLHHAVVQGLKPGGVFVLEAFSKQQLGRGTGGPQTLDHADVAGRTDAGTGRPAVYSCRCNGKGCH